MKVMTRRAGETAEQFRERLILEAFSTGEPVWGQVEDLSSEPPSSRPSFLRRLARGLRSLFGGVPPRERDER